MLCRKIASALRPIVYRSPSAAFRIAKPVEHKQPIAAGAGEVPIPGGACLIAMESMSSTMALGGCRARADNPSHRGIASRAVGVVYVLMATEAAEDGLAKQSRHRVPAVLAGARIDILMAGHVRQAERVIKLAAGRLSGVGGDSGTVDSSFRRRSKSSRRGPSTGSSAGFAICRAPKCAQDIFSYDGTDDQSHQSMEPYGKCGVRPSCRYASPAMLLLARCSCLLKVETRSRRPILLCVRETQHNDGLQGKFDPAERMAGFILNFLRWRRA